MTHRDRSASEASEQTEKLNLVKFGQGQWVPRSMGAKVNGCQGQWVPRSMGAKVLKLRHPNAFR